MNSSEQLSVLDRSPLVRLVKWFFSGRGLRRMLILLAWAVTILALVYGEENWRGRRAWNRYRSEREARGEQFDLTAFIPKPVPEDQNFANTPFVRKWFEAKPSNAPDHLWPDDFEPASSRISVPDVNDRPLRTFVDLALWKEAFEAVRAQQPAGPQSAGTPQPDAGSRVQAAPAVMDALKPSESIFNELREASRRPYCRYPIKYELGNPWAIILPHASRLRAACSRLQLRACAELALGESDRALADVELMLYLADSVKDEPFLVCHLVRVACVKLAVQPIWEGLAEHRWNAAQLETLEHRLGQYDFPKDIERPCGAEQAAGVLTVDLIRKKGNLGELLRSMDNGFHGNLALWLACKSAPSGWYFQEQLNYCLLLRGILDATFDPAKGRIFPDQADAAASQLERALAERFPVLIRHRMIGRILLPALNKAARKFAGGQTAANQAEIACTLERSRLANGRFPDHLASLAPQFIDKVPNDVLTGEPYKYRCTGGQTFSLYSVGWNEKDDGGAPGKTMFDDKNGDWVW